jgi:hypothetical protein
MSQQHSEQAKTAIIAESLYLCNLLLLPGISFLILLWLFITKKNISSLERIHLIRCIQLSLAAAALIFIPLMVILFVGDFASQFMILLLYFIMAHATFVIIGMYNLTKAMVKKLPLF